MLGKNQVRWEYRKMDIMRALVTQYFVKAKKKHIFFLNCRLYIHVYAVSKIFEMYSDINLSARHNISKKIAKNVIPKDWSITPMFHVSSQSEIIGVSSMVFSVQRHKDKGK